jgi:hypothetical protein
VALSLPEKTIRPSVVIASPMPSNITAKTTRRRTGDISMRTMPSS